MTDSLHIAELIVRKMVGSITSNEQQELDRWISSEPENQRIYQRVMDPKSQLDKLEVYRMFNKEKVRSALEDELFGSKIIQFTPRRIMRFAAAILLPVLLAGAIAIYLFRTPASIPLAQIDNVIQPGKEQAVLVLSDGRKVELSQSIQMNSVKDGNALIAEQQDRIIYSSATPDAQQGNVVYNELRIPRGGTYALQLSDGTSIRLNAGSSLRFPATFSDTARDVYLQGEAYFEVTHTGQPFTVHAENSETRVLGTSFNISAYSDDLIEVTTLVEGKVEVTATKEPGTASTSLILTPNEQARFNKEEQVISKSEVDASGFVSWIDGKMEFHNESLEMVMQKLSRWYNFEYRFQSDEARNYHFSARLERDASISSILEMLEMTTEVKFSLEEEVIVIK